MTVMILSPENGASKCQFDCLLRPRSDPHPLNTIDVAPVHPPEIRSDSPSRKSRRNACLCRSKWYPILAPRRLMIHLPHCRHQAHTHSRGKNSAHDLRGCLFGVQMAHFSPPPDEADGASRADTIARIAVTNRLIHKRACGGFRCLGW